MNIPSRSYPNVSMPFAFWEAGDRGLRLTSRAALALLYVQKWGPERRLNRTVRCEEERPEASAH